MTHTKIQEALDVALAAKAERRALEAEIDARLRREYVEAGGCARCMGAHRIVVASYSDGDDYGPCDVCRGESPERCTRRDQHPHDVAALDAAQENEGIADVMYDAAKDLWSLEVGSTVEVVKGRKVPRGTKGVVTGLYDGQWGTRVGIRVDGQTLYTAVDNVAVIKPSIDAEHSLPGLYGSEKQKAWATRLRQEAIETGRVTAEQVRAAGIDDGMRYAKWWIDNRPQQNEVRS